ncbi:MAG: phosphoribosyl-AMP cyclohydrolase, partial [Eubacteriaceae bacterium]|nr:phosphoribosyl-AMP cyclohydrolase [Eubacteriaceae bacterium]
MNADFFSQLKFNDQGLIPAVLQDYHTRQVLMMAWMNEASLKMTLDTKKATFYSRSRKQLWVKGETSGNVQHVVSVDYDCDGDTLLL